MRKWFGVFLVLAALAGLQAACYACTDFQLKADDGSVVIGRSNEFGIDAKSQIVFEPAGKEIASKVPGGAKGVSWKNRYAFVGINGFGLKESFADGLNEAGLSLEGLLFTDSVYETIGAADSSKALSSLDFTSWVLGNFATIDEVKAALPRVKVWGEKVEAVGGSLNLHFAIHDAAGKNLVVEFIKGEKKVYDNPIGTMTNMPELPWQLTHLRCFLNVDKFNAEPKNFRGVTITPTGQGAGWHGLPGDWSPPSRFVRMAYLSTSAFQGKNVTEALNQAKHILNTVDITRGIVQDRVKGIDMVEITQWSVLKDLRNAVLYYYTYDDMNLKSIDLKKMAKDKAAKTLFIPMARGFNATDVRGEMQDLK